ncbi:GntR family transcriptional regulator [Actinomycetota bacterium]
MAKEIFKPVDKQSRIPLYVQVLDQFILGIEKKHLKEGEKIGNEYELCELFKVSRFTLRQALKELENDGQIYKKRGKGTYIGIKKLETNLMQRPVFTTDEFIEKGVSFKNVIRKKSVIKAPTRVRVILKLSENAKVNYIERIRTVENGVTYVTLFYVSEKYCKGYIDSDLEAQKSSIHIIEEKYNLNITKVERSLEPIPPDKYEWIAEILEMNKGEWFHYMQSTIYINNNTPIGYYRDFFPGTKSKFILRGKL